MKKFLLLMIVMFTLVLVTGCSSKYDHIEKPKLVEGKEKVMVYMFRMDGCPHCEHELSFFKEIEKEFGDYYELVTFESAQNQGNSDFYGKVCETLEDCDGTFPFTIIGDYTFGGFASTMSEEVLTNILMQYEKEDYVDKVKPIMDEMDDEELNPTNLQEAMIEEGLITEKETKKASKAETGIVIGVFAAVIIGFGALIYISTKKN